MTEEKFDEWLDDVYPVYRIGEMTFYPSQILKDCDPVAYRIALSEMEDDDEEEEAYLAS